MSRQLYALIFCCTLFSTASSANPIHKCKGLNGEVVFSDKPCIDGELRKGSGWVSLEEIRRADERAAQKKAAEKIENERKALAEQEKKKAEDKARYQNLFENAKIEARKSEEERKIKIESIKADGKIPLEYFVNGYGKARITLSNAQGGTEQHEVSLPWLSQVYGVKAGFISYISAQINSDSTHIRVEILLDGVSVKQSESSGRYAIAQAKGRL